MPVQTGSYVVTLLLAGLAILGSASPCLAVEVTVANTGIESVDLTIRSLSARRSAVTTVGNLKPGEERVIDLQEGEYYATGPDQRADAPPPTGVKVGNTPCHWGFEHRRDSLCQSFTSNVRSSKRKPYVNPIALKDLLGSTREQAEHLLGNAHRAEVPQVLVDATGFRRTGTFCLRISYGESQKVDCVRLLDEGPLAGSEHASECANLGLLAKTELTERQAMVVRDSLAGVRQWNRVAMREDVWNGKRERSSNIRNTTYGAVMGRGVGVSRYPAWSRARPCLFVSSDRQYVAYFNVLSDSDTCPTPIVQQVIIATPQAFTQYLPSRLKTEKDELLQQIVNGSLSAISAESLQKLTLFTGQDFGRESGKWKAWAEERTNRRKRR